MSDAAVIARDQAIGLARTLREGEAGADPLLDGVLLALQEVIRSYLAGTLDSPAADPDAPDPRYVRLGEILQQRSPRGATAGELAISLAAEGTGARRETLHRWLASYERQGLARRPAIPHRKNSRWTWAGAA
jgi:hypothetical protein